MLGRPRTVTMRCKLGRSDMSANFDFETNPKNINALLFVTMFIKSSVRKPPCPAGAVNTFRFGWICDAV